MVLREGNPSSSGPLDPPHTFWPFFFLLWKTLSVRRTEKDAFSTVVSEIIYFLWVVLGTRNLGGWGKTLRTGFYLLPIFCARSTLLQWSWVQYKQNQVW